MEEVTATTTTSSKPSKGTLIAALGHGVTLREKADGNDAWILAHLRDGDQVERDAASRWQAETGTSDQTPLKTVCVWVHEDLIGKWSSYQIPGDTLLCDRRAWAWETTEAADRHWRTFVRMTLPVWKTLWLIEDAHVSRAILAPWAGYEKTLRWQARYFRQREIRRVVFGDVPHIIYELYRDGAGEGRKHGN